MITTRVQRGHASHERFGRRFGAAVSVSLALALAVVLAGCGDGGGGNPVGPGPSTSSSQFTGTFASGFEAGLLSVSLPVANLAPSLRAPQAADTVVTAHAVMSLEGGEVVTLTGSYDTTADSVTLAGGAWAMTGAYDSTATPPILAGTFTGPNGAGRFVCFRGNSDSVRVFCGEFENDATSLAGRWNGAISGTTLRGFMGVEDAASVTGFAGVADMATGPSTLRLLVFSSSGTSPTLTGIGHWDTSTGRLRGTWFTDVDGGPWSAEPCLQGGGGPN